MWGDSGASDMITDHDGRREEMSLDEVERIRV
jgi:hypothetical protein